MRQEFHYQEVWEEASLPASFFLSPRLVNHNQGSENSCSKESNPNVLTTVFPTIVGSNSSFFGKNIGMEKGISRVMSRVGTWPEPGEDEGEDEAEGETDTSLAQLTCACLSSDGTMPGGPSMQAPSPSC